ncbi:MAG: hypothetical protein IPO36_19230 [Anaerolineales bacterium]|nr:hypothetical protein [Anaerolineales bacterium]
MNSPTSLLQTGSPGWVWQSLLGTGSRTVSAADLFDPNNLLTRGQIVTIFNNVSGTFFANPYLCSVDSCGRHQHLSSSPVHLSALRA